KELWGGGGGGGRAVVGVADWGGSGGRSTADGPGRISLKGIRPQAIPDAAEQAMLDRTVESLRATVAQQQQEIGTLTAQLKENAAQIQKANAQLEMDKPAAKVVVNQP